MIPNMLNLQIYIKYTISQQKTSVDSVQTKEQPYKNREQKTPVNTVVYCRINSVSIRIKEP